MTLDEAIKHCEEVAEANDQGLYDAIALGGQNLTQEEITACEQCAADHRQLAEWLTELKEAKRLLRLAVEDFKVVMENDDICSACNFTLGCCKGEMCKWRFTDEAEKLLGEKI